MNEIYREDEKIMIVVLAVENITFLKGLLLKNYIYKLNKKLI